MLTCLNQANRLSGDAFTPAGKSEFFSGRGFHVHRIDTHLAVLGNMTAHLLRIGGQFWQLTHHGAIDVRNCVALSL